MLCTASVEKRITETPVGEEEEEEVVGGIIHCRQWSIERQALLPPTDPGSRATPTEDQVGPNDDPASPQASEWDTTTHPTSR